MPSVVTTQLQLKSTDPRLHTVADFGEILLRSDVDVDAALAAVFECVKGMLVVRDGVSRNLTSAPLSVLFVAPAHALSTDINGDDEQLACSC